MLSFEEIIPQGDLVFLALVCTRHIMLPLMLLLDKNNVEISFCSVMYKDQVILY